MKLKRKKSEERLVCRGGKIELEIYFSRPPPFFFFLSFFLKKTRKQIAGPFISLAAPALLSLKRTIALYAMLPSRSPSVDSKAAQSRPLSRFPIPPSIANHRRRRQQRHHPSTSKTTTTAAALPTIPAANGKLRVSTLGLGTWSWGNRFLYGYDTSQDASIAEAFKEAASAGVTLFDSADSYGTGALSGRAESLLGSFLNDRALCSRDYRDSRVVAATKIAPYPWRVTGKMFEAAARASVARMSGNGGGGDSSNSSNSSSSANPLLPPSRVVIQLHWSAANYAPPQEAALWDGLLRCYDAGLCSAVGVSNFGPKQLAKISRFLEKNGVPLAVAQTQYSLLSCGSETEAAISASRDAGAVPLAYSPLALGMLSGRYSLSSSNEGNRNSSSSSRSRSNEITNLPKGPRAFLFKKVLPGARGLLEVIDAVARETKVSSSATSASAGKEGGLLGSLLSTPFSRTTTTAATPAQVAIAWCVAKNTVPIPGARTARDVRSHVAAAAARLPAGAVEELDAAARGVKGGMTKNVFVTK